MSQSKKKRAAKRSVEQAPSAKATDRERKERRMRLIIASVVIALILVIIGVGYYQSYAAPYHLTIITVDDTAIRMDYFLKRTRLAGSDPLTMLGNLAREQLIKLEAPKYGIKVSPEDINQALRRTAGGASGNITESEFKEWYRQQLNESGLSDSEYKEIIGTSLLTSKLQEYLAERMPTVAEQVHLHIITVDTQKEVERVRARWEAGENFADLAREVSLDVESKEKGGDLGWVPRGVLNPMLDYPAFNLLSTGNVSEPIPIISDTTTEQGEPTQIIVGYYLLMVSEKADAREVDEQYLPTLRDRVLNDWFSQELGLHKIKYYGLNKNKGFDSETSAWINYQLAKNTPSTQQGPTQ